MAPCQDEGRPSESEAKREAVSRLMFLKPEVVVLVEVNPAAPQLLIDRERKS